MSGDLRSVGELLLDADLTARSMMLDLNVDRAQAMLRTWPATVQAAAAFWDALPDGAHPRMGGQTLPAAPMRVPMQHLTAEAKGMQSTFAVGNGWVQMKESWPPPGEPDSDLTRIQQDFRQAADLISQNVRPHSRQGEWTAAQKGDLRAACARAMHTVYVSAHAVASTSEDFATAEKQRTGQRQNVAGRDLKPGRQATVLAGRMRQMERIAGEAVHQQSPPRSSRGQAAPVGVDRLRHAVSQWNQATAQLGEQEMTTGQMRWICRVEGVVSASTAFIAQAGQSTAAFPEEAGAALQARLQASQQQWSTAERFLGQLCDTADLPPRAQVLAGNELLASLRELTWDGNTPAPASVLATRVDLTQAAGVLHVAQGHATLRAGDMRQAVSDNRVRARARPLNRQWLREGGTHRVGAAIPPAEVNSNALRPLLPTQRGQLDSACAALVTLCERSESSLERIMPATGHGHGIAETLGTGSPQAAQQRKTRLEQLLSSPVPTDTKPGAQPVPETSTASIRRQTEKPAHHRQDAGRRPDHMDQARARLAATRERTSRSADRDDRRDPQAQPGGPGLR